MTATITDHLPLPDRMAPPPVTRRSPTTMALHWGAAAALVAAFGLGLLMEDMPRGAARDTTMMVHYSLGTLVLAAATLRLLRRLLLPQPASTGRGLTAMAASAMHGALYLIMIALPMSGAMDRWARGRPLRLFGDNLIAPPFPIGGGKLWIEAHEVMAWTLVGLVAAHAGAALWHHLVLKDGVLRRMLPVK